MKNVLKRCTLHGTVLNSNGNCLICQHPELSTDAVSSSLNELCLICHHKYRDHIVCAQGEYCTVEDCACANREEAMSDLGRLKENAYDNVSRTITRIFDVPCDATMDSIVYALGEIQAKLCDSNNRLCAALKVPEDAEKVVAMAASELTVLAFTHQLGLPNVEAALALIPPALARVAELEGASAADKQRLKDAAEKAHVTYFGCDTPDHLAEKVLELEAENAKLRDTAMCAEHFISVLDENRKDIGLSNCPRYEGENILRKSLAALKEVPNDAR